MSWARLDDRWHDHPKTVAAGLEGAGLFAMCLTWAHQARRTSPHPGVVPDAILQRFAGRKARRLAQILHQVGYFDDHVEHGWPIHDFGDYLPKYDSDQASKAGRIGAEKRWGSGNEPPSQPDSKPPPSVNSGSPSEPWQTNSTRASARRNPDPDPVLSTGHQSSTGPSARGQTIDDDGLDQIASITKGGRAHAQHVADDVLSRAGGPVRRPLAYVLQAVRDKPESYASQSGRHPPGPRDPRCPTHPGEHRDRCRGCAADRLAARPSADAGVGASDEPPW